ncbi:hypothetical protein HZA73_08280 [candidate division TA06 bacterium]|nr:hypothetical protein [candidate division TA06 bacterium]
MSRLNKPSVINHIAEAREELQAIEGYLSSNKDYSEIELQIGLEHAYHHLNFAWNTRRATDKKIKNMSDAEWNQYGKFPKDIELLKLPLVRKKENK